MQRVTQVLGLWLLAAASGAAHAEVSSLEARKDGVQVLAEAKRGAAVKTTLKKGEMVESDKKIGMFWEVKTKAGESGYVIMVDVARKAGGETGGVSEKLRAAAKEGRDNKGEAEASRSRSAVMGIRGLKNDGGQSAFAGNVKPNLRVVYAMEDYAVPKENVVHLGDAVLKEVEVKLNRKEKGSPAASVNEAPANEDSQKNDE